MVGVDHRVVVRKFVLGIRFYANTYVQRVLDPFCVSRKAGLPIVQQVREQELVTGELTYS